MYMLKLSASLSLHNGHPAGRDNRIRFIWNSCQQYHQSKITPDKFIYRLRRYFDCTALPSYVAGKTSRREVNDWWSEGVVNLDDQFNKMFISVKKLVKLTVMDSNF